MRNGGRSQFLRGSCGRYAGMGMKYDDYSEDSGNEYEERIKPIVRFPLDKRTPESLNGECIIVQKGRKTDG